MIQIGNGNWAVKEDNLLGYRYDETEGVYFPREMTFGRACDATRVNPDGLVERVPYNLIQQSQTFENWTVGSVTVSANSTTAPDGTLSADTLTEAAATAQHQLISATASFASGVGYSFSIYAKASTSYVLQLTHNNAFSSNLYANFDLQNGVVGTYGAGTVASISDAGNGWYRCTIYGVATATASGSFLAVLVDDNTSASRRPSYAGDGTSGVYIWGAQLVEGTTAKPYFPTTNRQDIARIDYSSGTGALLLEPQRTNTMLNSENLNSWLKLDTSVTSNSTTSPDGTQNADTVTATGSGSLSHLIYQNLAFTSGTAHTLSVFAKANTSNFIQLVFPGNLIANSYANFDLVNGTITASANLTPKIESMGNGWYRCSVSATAFSSGTNSQIAYLINSGTASRGQAFTANGESVYLWGGQFEASSYATSYIPTTSATVTRLADTCYKTGVADWIGQTEGTLFADFVFDGLGTEQRLGISDGTSANYNNIRITTGGTLYVLGAASSVLQYEINCASLSIGNRYKVALAYKQNDIIVYLNGSNVGSDNSATIGACSRFGFDNRDATSVPFRSPINHATLYKTRLSNSELAALTTI